jgi:hypothetical protein
VNEMPLFWQLFLTMEIDYLNHASIIIRDGSTSLLIDPWLWGTCFEDGWGLRYDNPDALNKTTGCTHLWVSHFHQDHFHRPTLKKIQELNPGIIFIGNHSYNFQMDEVARQIGFKNVIPLYERKPLQITADLTITRYPTTGIDNMLFIKTSKESILNFNDCNIPLRTQRMMKKKIGHIDLLLTNFNHAGKLFYYPYPGAQIIKHKLVKSFSDNYEIFDPNYVLPFASYHYYRAPESFIQNEAMLTSDNLLSLDKRIINWKPGDKLTFKEGVPEVNQESTVTINKPEQLTHTKTYSFDQLKEAADSFSKIWRKRFGFPARFFPELIIHVSDSGELVSLQPYKGLRSLKEKKQPHIKAHSESLYNWLSKPYGTDSFVVGAHFEIVNENKVPLKWKIVIGLMVDNKLDFGSVMRMMFKKHGLRFLWNRREEFIGILLSWRLSPSYHDD